MCNSDVERRLFRLFRCFVLLLFLGTEHGTRAVTDMKTEVETFTTSKYRNKVCEERRKYRI